jgi:hypothetical protein
MDLAVERVDLHCLVEVAGLAVPLLLAEEVALSNFQRCAEAAESAVPQGFMEEAGLAGPQRFVEEAGLVGSAMVVGLMLVEQSCSLRPPYNILEGILD